MLTNQSCSNCRKPASLLPQQHLGCRSSTWAAAPPAAQQGAPPPHASQAAVNALNTLRLPRKRKANGILRLQGISCLIATLDELGSSYHDARKRPRCFLLGGSISFSVILRYFGCVKLRQERSEGKKSEDTDGSKVSQRSCSK
ncbi:hypothetical protein GN956_G26798 [Arapaima gigas]